MARHVVATVAEIPPGARKRVEVEGRPVAIFNVEGEFFALVDRCPHQGASLCQGKLVGLVESTAPGQYRYSRHGEIIRCPWHGWEFDIKTGRSFCSGIKARARPFPVHVEPASPASPAEGPYRAETIPVRVEDSLVVVEA